MDLSTDQRPVVSVIIASYNAKQTIGKCLQALRSQETDEDFEIIVVDSSTDGTAELVAKQFPEIELHHFQKRKFCGDARNVGIAAAKGKIIALTDADCTASGSWVQQIVEAHLSPHLAIGGAIANVEPSNLVSWAAYFCEFSQWIPGSKPRWLEDIAGANMSYKKEAFDTYGPLLEGTYCSDSEFHWRLGRDGLRLLFLPEIVVSHQSIDDLTQFLRHEFEHGRCFARVRLQGQAFSRWRRMAYVLLSTIIPLKILLRTSANTVANRTYLPHFLPALPLVAAGVVSWSVGEFVGYCSA